MNIPSEQPAHDRWARLICYQNFSESLLPPELQSANPLGVRRMVNGEWKTGPMQGGIADAAAAGSATPPYNGIVAI